MVKIKYFCDICGKEIPEGELKRVRLSVLRMDLKNSGYTNEEIEVCEHCRDLCTPLITYGSSQYKLRDYYKNGYTDNQQSIGQFKL